MNFRWRFMSALIAVVLLAPTLAGCTFFAEGAADHPNDELTRPQQQLLVEGVTRLRQIAGIGEVSVAAISSELWESAVMVEVDVSEAFAAEQAGAVAATMNRASGNGIGPALPPIQEGSGNVFSTFNNSGYELWSLPGLNASGQLPPKEVIELLDDISQILPLQENAWLDLADDLEARSPEGAIVRWTDDDTVLQGRDVAIVSLDYREEDWPAIVAAATHTTRLTGFDFRYFSFGREFRFHTSPCDGTIEQTADDQLLFDALLAGGIASLEEVAPGQCTPDYY